MEDHEKPGRLPDAEEPLSAKQQAELDEYAAAWDNWAKVEAVKETIAGLDPKEERELLREQREKLRTLMKRVSGRDYQEPDPEFDPYAPLEGDKPAPARATIPGASLGRQNKPPGAKSRRNMLDHAIETAQVACNDPFDTNQVFAQMCVLVDKKMQPLLGLTESGIKWMNDSDEPHELSKKALGDRLRRQRDRLGSAR